MSSKSKGIAFFNENQLDLDYDVNVGNKSTYVNLNLNQNLKEPKLDTTMNYFSNANAQTYFDNYYGNDDPLLENHFKSLKKIHMQSHHLFQTLLNLNEDSVKTVPKSNKLCEFVFSNIDYGYKLAPNQRFVRRETQVMARVNRVFEWFSGKSEEEQKKILQQAIFAAPQLAKDAAEEEKNLQDAIYRRLCEQHASEVIAAGAKQDKKDNACRDVILYGGEWTTHEMMDEYLQNLSEPMQKKAIAAQLKYHKFVLETQLVRQLHSLIDLKIEKCEEEENV